MMGLSKQFRAEARRTQNHQDERKAAVFTAAAVVVVDDYGLYFLH